MEFQQSSLLLTRTDSAITVNHHFNSQIDSTDEECNEVCHEVERCVLSFKHEEINWLQGDVAL